MKDFNELPEVQAAYMALLPRKLNVHSSTATQIRDVVVEAFKAIQNQSDSSIQKLIDLQAELGYVKGDISTVAMLGLVGEAGEVLGEIHTVSNTIMYNAIGVHIKSTLDEISDLESYKKLIRKEDKKFVPIFEVHPDKGEDFNKELADTFYYLQALATNRGLTIMDLAKMAHDKIRAKQAAGGSSEDKR
jgi:hypothetical protein